MLKEFSVKNYLSFKDEVIFSMEALTDSVSEYPENVSIFNNNELLKVSSIYGPNAGGKSNLLKALMFFKEVVTSYVTTPTDDIFSDSSKKTINSLKQFAFTDEKNNKTQFKFFAVTSHCELGYELELKLIKKDLVIVNYESMSFKGSNDVDFINMYERKENKVELNENLEQELGVKTFHFSNQVTFIAFINALYIKKGERNPKYLNIIKDLYSEITKIHLLSSFRDIKKNEELIRTFYKGEGIKNLVINMLNDLDIKIKDIEVDTKGSNPKFDFIREIDGKDYKLNLYSESDGTLSLIYLLPFLYIFKLTDGIILIDELNAHLHPKLTKEIIKSFQSVGNRHSQLIFTSHDITNMDNNLFRRDEIWFVVKDEKYSSDIFSLADIVNYKGEKIRKDAKFNKQYLEGRYGADPFIKKGIKWNG